LARWRHFSIDLLWILNGAAFYVLLFTTNQGQRLIAITWDVFPNAISTAIQYASLNFPVDHTWTAITAFNTSAILSLSYCCAGVDPHRAVAESGDL
jgi:methionine sulfoxide reductase catalytic subunit